jgi:hypothetical protein
MFSYRHAILQEVLMIWYFSIAVDIQQEATVG